MLIVLIALALFSSARRNRYEDAAILILAGGAVSAEAVEMGTGSAAGRRMGGISESGSSTLANPRCRVDR